MFFLSPEGLPFENGVQLLTDTPGKKDTAFDTWLTIPLEKGVRRGELCVSVQVPWDVNDTNSVCEVLAEDHGLGWADGPTSAPTRPRVAQHTRTPSRTERERVGFTPFE